jgi:hypothetical protein
MSVISSPASWRKGQSGTGYVKVESSKGTAASIVGARRRQRAPRANIPVRQHASSPASGRKTRAKTTQLLVRVPGADSLG